MDEQQIEQGDPDFKKMVKALVLCLAFLVIGLLLKMLANLIYEASQQDENDLFFVR
jgi:hypothetical protein